MIPTEPGYYWAKINMDYQIVEVYRVYTKNLVVVAFPDGIENGKIYNISDFADWVGPLMPPTSPGDVPCWVTEGAADSFREQWDREIE